MKIQNVLPGPAVDMYSKGFGDAVSIWAPATYTAAQKGYQIAASSPDCGIRQPILLLADREFADKNPEQVRAFLRVYLRVVDAMHSEGFDAFVQEYIRFNKTWNEKLMTREEAVKTSGLIPCSRWENRSRFSIPNPATSGTGSAASPPSTAGSENFLRKMSPT